MKKRNKLNARPTKGFRSKWEHTVSEILRKYKVRNQYEPHKIPYILRKNYLPDWIVERKDGSTFYLEAKGRFTPEDKRKIEAVIESNPNIDLRMVFLSGNKKNCEWCELRMIPYAVGHVPKEWLE